MVPMLRGILAIYPGSYPDSESGQALGWSQFRLLLSNCSFTWTAYQIGPYLLADLLLLADPERMRPMLIRRKDLIGRALAHACHHDLRCSQPGTVDSLCAHIRSQEPPRSILPMDCYLAAQTGLDQIRDACRIAPPEIAEQCRALWHQMIEDVLTKYRLEVCHAILLQVVQYGERYRRRHLLHAIHTSPVGQALSHVTDR